MTIDIIYHDKNGYYGRPFMSGDNYNGDYNANTVTQLTNKFHVSTTTYRYLDYIKYEILRTYVRSQVLSEAIILKQIDSMAS